MILNFKKVLSILSVQTLLFFSVCTPFIYAQSPTGSQSEQDLINQIQDLENKIDELQGQEKTLSSQILAMDDQMKVTSLKIDRTKKQIVSVENSIEIISGKITSLEGSLDDVGLLLLERIAATYKAGNFQPLSILITSKNLSEFVIKNAYLKLVQDHDKKLMLSVQMSKVNFSEQKQALVQKQTELKNLKSQLESYTAQLAQQEAGKKTLLAQTQGSEGNYQKLLSAARAQLAGFQNFVTNQGGASLLSNQTNCNDWGCYYNQRDSQWGNQSLNHTQYTIASDGCLVTSMAMVITHYGHRTTPSDINNNPANFASYYPAYLLYTVYVNGISASRIGAVIDSTLSNHDPVIVGVHAYGGTHFVVLISGSGGNYQMNDPFIENGHGISFSDHYSLNSVFEVDRVSIG